MLAEEVVSKIYSVDEPRDMYASLCRLCVVLRGDREVMRYIEEKVFNKESKEKETCIHAYTRSLGNTSQLIKVSISVLLLW